MLAETSRESSEIVKKEFHYYKVTKETPCESNLFYNKIHPPQESPRMDGISTVSFQWFLGEKEVSFFKRVSQFSC